MTAKLTIYKSLLTDEVLLEKSTSQDTLSKALFACKELHGECVIVYVNDVMISPDDWYIYKLESFDDIRVVPDPNKGSLGFIGAIIGVAIAIAFPPAAGFSLALAFKFAAIGYTIGSMADSLLFPPTMPKIPGLPDGSGSGSDPNYGWDGARLLTQPDGPVSVLYGQHIISGTLIMSYTSSDGDKNYLNMLINLGEGEISGIMKSDESGVCTSTSDTPYIEINGQAYTNYTNCTWDYRLGTYNQTVIDGFHNTSTYYEDGRKITKGTQLTYTTTGTDIEEVELQLTCPTLFAQDDQGNVNENSVVYKVEYQVVGAGSWTVNGTYTITNKSKTVVYEYKKISNLTSGQYNIRITRETPEYTSFKKGGDLYLSGVTETVYENIAYRNSALLALKLQATDQLSGSIPNITVLVRGKKIMVPCLQIASVTQNYDSCYWDDTASTYKLISGGATCTDTGNYVRQWSRHPIWCSRDFITNRRYGLGEYIDNSDFDSANAAIEARYCWELVTDFNGGTEHRFEMDLPISRFMAAPSAKKLLSHCFRGDIIWSNGIYKPVIDRAKTSIQLFNESNIIPGTLKTTYLKASAIPNYIDVQYADPDRSYNLNSIPVVDETEWTSVKPLRQETVNAQGTVRASEVLRTGKYYLNNGKYVTKTHEFDCDLDAIHCELWDTVQVQNDLLAWGVGGRVVSATSNSVTTNIDITYTAGYTIRVRLSDGSLEVKTVTSVTNNNRTINISGTFTSVPLTDSVFSYGAADVDSKPFKVKQMTIKDKNICSIVLAEESANKYIDTTGASLPDPKYTTLPNPTDPPDNVTDLDLTEMTNRPGFYISFNIPQEDLNFSYADVHLSMDNSYWWPYRNGVNKNSNIEVLGTKPGQIYYVKVIAYNRLGFANLSPVTDNITITDLNFIPPDINGLRLDGETTLNTTIFTKKDAKFVWRKGSLTSGAGHLPAGQEVLGAGQWYDDVYYKYWVEIHVSGVQVRKEIIADNAYVYTFEKNVADNTTASNTFTIKVWGFNEAANKRSLHPATLAVTNSAPAAPSGLVAASWWEAIKFTWNINSEIDFSYYYYRIRVETDAWSDWVSTTDNNIFRSLTAAEQTAHGSNAIIYLEIIAYDTFGNYSSTNSVNGTTSGLDIQASDIEDFAITSSKIFTKIPIISGDTWTDASPSAGYVAWNEHSLYYNGALYTIAAGNTNNKYIYWNGSASVYSTSDNNPTLTDGQFIIATNISGVHDLAWNAIANQVIGSAYIQEAAIQTAHIENLAVTNAKIESLDAGKITTGYLNASVIDAGTITADMFISTLYGDLNQAMDYVKTVLGAGDEYEHDVTAVDLSNGVFVNIDALTHIDYGLSIRIATEDLWDEAGLVWDTGTWDVPTEASGSWTSSSHDIGSLSTLQLALRFTMEEDTPASTTPTITAQYSMDNINFGANSPTFDDNNWETLTQKQITGDIYKAAGNLYSFRYFKIKVALATTDTGDRIIIHTMTFLGNVITLFGRLVNQTVAAGGTGFPLSGFNETPAITVTSVGATPLVPLITAQSSSNATINLFNLAGNDVGGRCNVTLIGV